VINWRDFILEVKFICLDSMKARNWYDLWCLCTWPNIRHTLHLNLRNAPSLILITWTFRLLLLSYKVVNFNFLFFFINFVVIGIFIIHLSVDFLDICMAKERSNWFDWSCNVLIFYAFVNIARNLLKIGVEIHCWKFIFGGLLLNRQLYIRIMTNSARVIFRGFFIVEGVNWVCFIRPFVIWFFIGLFNFVKDRIRLHRIPRRSTRTWEYL